MTEWMHSPASGKEKSIKINSFFSLGPPYVWAAGVTYYPFVGRVFPHSVYSSREDLHRLAQRLLS